MQASAQALAPWLYTTKVFVSDTGVSSKQCCSRAMRFPVAQDESFSAFPVVLSYMSFSLYE